MPCVYQHWLKLHSGFITVFISAKNVMVIEYPLWIIAHSLNTGIVRDAYIIAYMLVLLCIFQACIRELVDSL